MWLLRMRNYMGDVSSMSIVLRPYQEGAIQATMAALANNPLLVAPTGAGKTVMGQEVAKRFLHDMTTRLNKTEGCSRKVLWLAHRKELIEQAAYRLSAAGLHTGIVMAGYRPAPQAPVQVASVQTLARRSVPQASLVVVDEAHHAAATAYQEVFAALPNVPRVGLTATPFRLDGRGLGPSFGELVIAAYTDELVATGTLHAPKVYAAASPDLRGVRVVAGDYAIGALSERMNTDAARADIVKEWQRLASGRRTVCFAVDVEHSKEITAAFVAAGVQAEHLDATTGAVERGAILGRLRAGETTVVSNCMILTEGWDLPALEVAIIARPTASLNLHWQMVGRIMRAAEGKEGAMVLDHAGNHFSHGLVTRRINYSLDGVARVGESEPLDLKRCPMCQLLVPPMTPLCPECGHVFQSDRERPAIDGNGKLVELGDDRAIRFAAWHSLEAQREAGGYREGWSKFRYQEMFGEWPLVIDGELVDPMAASSEQKEAYYAELLKTARSRGFQDGWASHKYKEVFSKWPTKFVSRTKARLADLPRWEPPLTTAPPAAVLRPAWVPPNRR